MSSQLFLPTLPSFAEGAFVRMGPHIVRRAGEALAIGSSWCPHRGMEMLEEGHSSCSATLTCPYHGLPFKASRMAHIESGLFCSLSQPPEPVQAVLANVAAQMGPCFQTERHVVQCRASIWLANTLDPNHLDAVHKGGFGALFEGEPYAQEMGEAWSSYKMRVRHHIRASYVKANVGLSQPSFWHFMAFPNLSITSFLGVFFSIETAMPLSPSSCLVTTQYYTARAGQVPPALIRAAQHANSVLLLEDRQICEKLEKSPVVGHGLKLRGEERLAHYLTSIGEWGTSLGDVPA